MVRFFEMAADAISTHVDVFFFPGFRGVSLTIRKGEFVCIFGTSGGGKTTMLNILGTIDKPTKGELRLCGTRTFIGSNRDRIRSNDV